LKLLEITGGHIGDEESTEGMGANFKTLLNGVSVLLERELLLTWIEEDKIGLGALLLNVEILSHCISKHRLHVTPHQNILLEVLLLNILKLLNV
jgi:hypothetical protein